MKRLLPLVLAAWLAGIGGAWAQQVFYLSGLSPAHGGGALAGTDTTFWCDLAAGCGPVDPLKRVTLAQISNFVQQGLNTGLSAIPPITYNSTSQQLGLSIDSTLSVVAGQLHVVGGGGGGSGTVTSVGLSAPSASIFGVGGSPVTTAGTLSLSTTGNSGGIPYFFSGTQLGTSGVLAGGQPVFGGGPGGAPVTGSVSGNTQTVVSQGSGVKTSGHVLVYDVSGNAIDGGTLPAGVSSVGLSAPTGFGVTGSPVTSSGTLGLTLTTENANSIWAGPTTGAAAQPTFRPMVIADIPTGIPLSDLASQAASTVVGNQTVGAAVPTALVMPSCADSSGNHLNFVPGTGFSCGNTSSSGSPLSGMTATQIPVAATATTVTSSVPQSTWLFSAAANGALSGTGAACLQADATGAISRTAGTCATGGSGSVTSVAQTVPAGFTIAGSPITTSGTLAIGLSTEAANTVWAGPTTGAATAPTFRALVANDLPSAGVHTLGTTSIALGSTTTSIAGLALTAAPSLALRDTSAAFDVTLGATSSPALSAGRSLTFDVENGARTIHLGSNLTITTDPGAVTGAIRSNGTGTFTQASCADLAGVGTGCSGTLPVGAAPSATIGASIVPGSATTFMRSDAAPPIGTNAVTNALLAQPTHDSVIGNTTAATTNASYVTLPSCSDSGGSHLNYTLGTGFSCGNSSTGGGTAPQAAYYNATGSTVVGNPNVSYQSGFTRLNYLTTPSGEPAAIGGTVLQMGGTDSANSRVELDSFGASGRYDAVCYGGTSGGLAAMASGVTCGGFNVFAYNGTSAVGPLGGIRMATAETQSAGHAGMNTIITSTPIGGSAMVDGLTLDSTQNITVAGLAGSGLRCTHVDATGKFSATSADCGTGGGGGADTVSPTVSAAGTNQGTCTNLTTQQNKVTTVGAGQGVCLAAATVGGHEYVCNAGANDLTVYAPAGGTTINTLSATAGFGPVATNSCALFISMTTTSWNSVP